MARVSSSLRRLPGYDVQSNKHPPTHPPTHPPQWPTCTMTGWYLELCGPPFQKEKENIHCPLSTPKYYLASMQALPPGPPAR